MKQQLATFAEGIISVSKNARAISWAALLVFFWALSSPARAGTVPPDWNLIGTYEVVYEVDNINSSFMMDITSEDFTTGDFGGVVDHGYLLSGGNSQGSQIHFAITFVPGLSFAIFDGAIASDGSFSGTLDANFGNGVFTGGWAPLNTPV